jgi:hypothetical protein
MMNQTTDTELDKQYHICIVLTSVLHDERSRNSLMYLHKHAYPR